MIIYYFGFFYGYEKFWTNLYEFILINIKRLLNTGNIKIFIFFINFYKSFKIILISLFTNIISNINGKKIRTVNKFINIRKVYMIRINKIILCPVKCFYWFIGFFPCILRICTNNLMFPVWFIPNRGNFYIFVFCFYNSFNNNPARCCDSGIDCNAIDNPVWDKLSFDNLAFLKNKGLIGIDLYRGIFPTIKIKVSFSTQVR